MNELDSSSRAITQSLGLSDDLIYQKALGLLKELNLCGSILDFGSGQGRFLSMLSGHTFEQVTGADIMERPTQISPTYQWVQADLNSKLSLEDNSFDVIVAIEVIEHLENPRAVVRELKRLLRPGGYLILSTPNNESIRSLLALLLKGHFVSFLDKDYPAHITALTALDIKRIFTEIKLQQPVFYYVNNGMVPGLKGLTWQQIGLGLFQGKRFSDNFFAVTRK